MMHDNHFYNHFDKETLGDRGSDSYRTPFQVDRDRIIHSYAFRRLQAKTQVFRPGEYDFYRTRLTHTIEVSQIGRSICNFLSKRDPLLSKEFYIDPHLVEAVCLAHDIGHPPFGHAGERTLNTLMSDFGGFEANAQTLRLIAETIYSKPSENKRVGLMPTRAFLDGVLKYKNTRSVVTTRQKFIYDDQRRFVDFAHGCTDDHPELTSIECQIMDWADDVAYSLGDFVDAVRARFITSAKLQIWAGEAKYGPIIDELLVAFEKREITRFAAHKIGQFIEACKLREVAGPLSSKTNRYRFALEIDEAAKKAQKCLKAIAYDLVFDSPQVQQLELKAAQMLGVLFRVLLENYVYVVSPRAFHHLLNRDIEGMFERAMGILERARLLCDHISGMSDEYVVRTYRRLFDPEFGSIVDLV